MMNDRFTNEQANLMAGDIIRAIPQETVKQVEVVYWRALARAPTKQELSDCQDFLKEMDGYHKQRGSDNPDQRRRQALADLCHVMFNLNEFVYQD